MQWLIDIIKEWVIAQGYLTDGFVNRGDPAVVDYVTGDLIKDNAWHDLDLSAIVPENVKGVALYVSILELHIGTSVRFRKKGNTNPANVSRIYNQVAFEPNATDMTVPCDENRKIQYFASNVDFVILNITVKGWWY